MKKDSKRDKERDLKTKAEQIKQEMTENHENRVIELDQEINRYAEKLNEDRLDHEKEENDLTKNFDAAD